MTVLLRRSGIALAALLLIASGACRSAPPAPEPAPTTEPTIAPPPPPPQEPTIEPISVPEKEPEPTTQSEPIPAEPIEEAEEEPMEELEMPIIEEELSPIEEVPAEEPAEEPFDPKTIPQEVFNTTKSDVQALIQQLNSIIRDKDYEKWVTFLGARYRAALSDNAFLERISASTILRKQKITLRSLRDYFIYVVVPSRANDRVDDIEFIGQNRVKAFTVDSKGRRLRLYDLEKTPSGWEIIN